MVAFAFDIQIFMFFYFDTFALQLIVKYRATDGTPRPHLINSTNYYNGTGFRF